MSATLSNWAGHHTYQAARVHYPETVEEIQALVRGARKVRALGSRHSFNDLADSPGDLISLARCGAAPVIDRERHTATVAAGVTYGQLAAELHAAGYALPNMASLPHISVAGAVATATHGSGDRNGNLATVVSGLEVVTADGTVVQLSRAEHGAEFAGAVVALGGLGVVTRLTLDLVPAFEIRQDVYENLPPAQLEAHFDEIFSSAYSVSLFTDWRPGGINMVWLKHRVTDGAPAAEASVFFGATPAPMARHPIVSLSAVSCTEQMGVPGPWYARLPHFRMEFTPSAGEELQTEYMVPRAQAVAAWRAVAALHEQVAPLLQITELRTIAADDLWMSPCYGQPCVAFHFTWLKNWPAVRVLLPRIEAALAPFQPAPHWGKLFTMPAAQVQARYPRLPDFQRLLQSYDPEGKFRNTFLDTYIFGAA
jgi:alditol oxidase